MKVHWLVISVVLLVVSLASATKKQQEDAKSCEFYLSKISDFPDGYRANLKLPILQNMSQGWTMKIKYTQEIRNFDTAMADVNRLSGNQEVYLKNRPQYRVLKSPGTFTLDFTIHHGRNIKKSIRIESIEFGSFRCGSGSAGAGENSCEEFISIVSIDSKHQLFDVRLPILVAKTNKPWLLEMGWTKSLSCFTHHGASTITQQKHWSTFRVVSKFADETLKTDQLFVKRFNVTFNIARSYVNMMKFGKFECNGNKSIQ